MKSCENKLSCMLNEDIGKLILRVSIAGLMLFHGFFKLFNGIDGIKYLVTQAGLPEFFAYGVYLGEILFPIPEIAHPHRSIVSPAPIFLLWTHIVPPSSIHPPLHGRMLLTSRIVTGKQIGRAHV